MALGETLLSLAGSALARVAPLVIRKAVRTARIDTVLKGGAASHPALETAINDFEVVVGSFYGELTESLDRFLREMEASGILPALAEDVISKHERQETKHRFEKLHISVFGKGVGNWEKLFENISASLQISFDYLAVDPTLNLLIQSISRRQAEQIARIEEQLTLLPQQSAPLSEVEPTLDRIAKVLSAAYRTVWQETHKGRKQVALEKIYIPSKLVPRIEDLIYSQALQKIHSQTRGRDSVRILTPNASENSIGFVELQKHFRRIVVLGDPGGGKSTLCQYICHVLCKQYGLGHRFDPRAHEGLQPQSVKIAIRVVLREFEAARSKEPQLSIFEYIVRDLVAFTASPRHQIETALYFSLEIGMIVLAFDGLDEILATHTRREYVDLVNAFCSRFEFCPVIVTSRLQGYDDAPLPHEFEQYVLAKFDNNEVVQYATGYLNVICGKEKEEASEKAKVFLQQTNAHAADLRSNPLMLGLMIFLFNINGNVPANRPEIYRECALLMYERWDQNRSILADIPSGFDMIDLFGDIAASIFGDSELENGVGINWLERHCQRYFLDKVFEDRAKAHEAAKKIVKFLGGRSWVLSEFGPDSFKFTHRTFMEYFFAHHFCEQHESISALISALLGRVAAGEWEVISQLALQIKTFRSTRRTSHAVAELLRALEDSAWKSEEILRISKYVADSLAYMLTSEQEVRQIIECVAPKLPFDEQSSIAATNLYVLRRICDAHVDRREYARGALADILVEKLAKSSESAWARGVALALIPRERDRILYRGVESITLPASFAQPVRSRLQQAMRERAMTSVSDASLYLAWYRSDARSLIATHGLQIFASERGLWLSNDHWHPSSLIIGAVFDVLDRRYSDKDPADVNILYGLGGANVTADDIRKVHGNVKKYFNIPKSMWLHAFKRVHSDRNLIRGLLIGYSVFNLGSSSRDPENLVEYIDGVLLKMKVVDAAEFGFWKDLRADDD